MTIVCSFVEIEEEEDLADYNETNPTPETKAYWFVPNNCRYNITSFVFSSYYYYLS
jgi:hypothetical protein